MNKIEPAREDNRIYVDSRAEIPGVVIENGSAVFTEDVVREITHPHHKLILLFSLPNELKMTVRRPELRTVYGGTLSFRPANVEYRVVFGPGRYKGIGLTFDPAHFPQITEAVKGCDIKALSNIIGSPMSVLLSGIAQAVVVDLIRFLNESEQKDDVRGALSQKELRRVMEHIEKSGDAVPTVEDLSRLLSISTRHFTRMFKASTGQTYHAYISQARVRKAIGLLTTTDLAAKDIAEKLGYTPMGFSAIFRKATGETPTEFRRRFAANNGDAVEPAHLAAKRH